MWCRCTRACGRAQAATVSRLNKFHLKRLKSCCVKGPWTFCKLPATAQLTLPTCRHYFFVHSRARVPQCVLLSVKYQAFDNFQQTIDSVVIIKNLLLQNDGTDILQCLLKHWQPLRQGLKATKTPVTEHMLSCCHKTAKPVFRAQGS